MTGDGATVIDAPMVAAPLRFQLRSGGQQTKSNALVTCPKCEAPAFIRKSKRITATIKHITCHCTNSGCGHIFTSEIVFIHSLVEGNVERPDLDLPVCPRDEVPHVLPPSRVADQQDQASMFEPDTG